jgi:elongation factor Ts
VSTEGSPTATVGAALVKELRERTGAGFMDCKRALEETGGDVERAVALLRERGLAAAARKADRATGDGQIGSYIHPGGRLGALVEVNCETDFVARTDEFQRLVRDLAIQIAGLAPQWVSAEAIPEATLEAKRVELRDEAATSRRAEQVRDQVVEGKLKKWQQQVVLLEQPYRDTDRTVGQYIDEKIVLLGENIRVRRFARFALGEDG